MLARLRVKAFRARREWFRDEIMEKRDLKKILWIILGLDLFLLVVSFLFSKLVFFILVLINVLILVTLFTIIIPLKYMQIISKQGMTPEEYYMRTIEKHYAELNESMLIKLFEMRISNLRTTVFSYLGLLLTFTIGILMLEEKYFTNAPWVRIILIIGGLIGILAIAYYSARIDREVIKESQYLFEGIRKLNQLKSENKK